MTKIIAIAAISLTLIAGCSQTTQTTTAGYSLGSAQSDSSRNVWPPRRHTDGGRG